MLQAKAMLQGYSRYYITGQVTNKKDNKNTYKQRTDYLDAQWLNSKGPAVL